MSKNAETPGRKRIKDETEDNYFGTFPDESYFKELIPNSFIINKPKNKVGGDGYWIQKEQSSLFLVIFNCFGNGHLASIMTRIYAKAIKDNFAGNADEFPNRLLMDIHESIKLKFESKKNILLATGAGFGIVKVNLQLQELEFAGAKMNLYEVTEEHKLKVIKADRMQIGDLFDFYHEYKTHIIDLKNNKSSFYLMSDGVKDLIGGPGNKKLGNIRLKKLIEEGSKFPMVEQKNYIKNSMTNWMGPNQALDDLLMIGFDFSNGLENLCDDSGQ